MQNNASCNKSSSTFPEYVRKPFRQHGATVLLCLALAAITFTVYMQTENFQFLNFDELQYVTNNSHVANGITRQNFVWAFTTVESSNWHPLTWLSHMADVQFFHMNPRGHHLTNVVIHTASALLLFLMLLRLTTALGQSFFVAALFALHPLHVESVAWVAERKDVLSALFCFLSLILYAAYVTKRKTTLYIFALCSFILGLMSKPMLVTLPILMLLIDFWPLGRFRCKELQFAGSFISLAKEKLPFIICSLLSGFITIYAQYQGGSIAGLNALPLLFRIENALVAYIKYIGKTFWPVDLAVLYPIPSAFPLWQVVGSLTLLFIISATAVRTWRRHPYFAVGWCWFIITLLPVIGLIQVGTQSMADRYTHIPLIGLFIVLVWGITDLTMFLRHRQQAFLALLAGMVIVASSALTWRQLGYWHDSISLFRHTLQVTTGNYIIHNNLGTALANKGNLNDAISEYQKALQINPYYSQAHYNLGLAFQEKGVLDSAIQEYREALRITPNHELAHFNLAIVLAAKGKLDDALVEDQETLRINPKSLDALNNFGVDLASKGKLDAAIQTFQEALSINPKDPAARANLVRTVARKSETRKLTQ